MWDFALQIFEDKIKKEAEESGVEPKPLHEYFDLICGSTGALMAIWVNLENRGVGQTYRTVTYNVTPRDVAKIWQAGKQLNRMQVFTYVLFDLY